MATADKIFISHTSADRKLADLLRDTLVLGGIPRERIFYSSSRATGIPSGPTSALTCAASCSRPAWLSN